MPDDPLDGVSSEGLHPSLAGRDGEPAPRQDPGCWSDAPGSTGQAGDESLRVGTDGGAAYPHRSRRAFREKVENTVGRGRACGPIWPAWQMGTVIQRTASNRGVEGTGKLAQGNDGQAALLLPPSAGGRVLTTAIIARWNGTMQERLATFTRKGRQGARHLRPLETGMDVMGSRSTFCWAPQERWKPSQLGSACTPAMAAGLTHPIWSVSNYEGTKQRPRRGSRPNDEDDERTRQSNPPS